MIIPKIFRYLFFRKPIDNTTMDAINDKNATLIDVRNLDELESVGSIKKAKHIPLMEIANRLEEIKGFSKPIVIFCAMGGRAGRAKSFLEANGVDNVHNAGGYSDVVAVLED